MDGVSLMPAVRSRPSGPEAGDRDRGAGAAVRRRHPGQRLGPPLHGRAHRPLHLCRLTGDGRGGALRPSSGTRTSSNNLAHDPSYAAVKARLVGLDAATCRRVAAVPRREALVKPPELGDLDHRPAALPAPLAGRARLAARADAQRRRARAHRPHLHATRSATRRCARRAGRPCSPGRFPAEHGVEPDAHRGRPAARSAQRPRRAGDDGRILRRSRGAARARAHAVRRAALLRLGPKPRRRAELPRGMANLGTLLRGGRLHGGLQGQVAPDPPARGEGPLLGGWTRATPSDDRARLGFADWEPPDAGENAKAEHFGGGNAGDGEGWDEVYTRQAERWLGRPDLPEPFCLVVSLVNPHDVLGYPASYDAGGYASERVPRARASGCRRPSTRTSATSPRSTR